MVVQTQLLGYYFAMGNMGMLVSIPSTRTKLCRYACSGSIARTAVLRNVWATFFNAKIDRRATALRHQQSRGTDMPLSTVKEGLYSNLVS